MLLALVSCLAIGVGLSMLRWPLMIPAVLLGALVPASFVAARLCGVDFPLNWSELGRCDASDPPSDVFVPFYLASCVLLVIVGLVGKALRRPTLPTPRAPADVAPSELRTRRG